MFLFHLAPWRELRLGFSTLAELLRDGLRFVKTIPRSRTALAAEILFLRKQLAHGRRDGAAAVNSRRRQKHQGHTMGRASWRSSLSGHPCAKFFFGKWRPAETGKQKNRIAMRTVEFNQAMSGKEGAQIAALLPAPLTWLTLCHCDVLL
jgi:hypothetical protein